MADKLCENFSAKF